MFGRYRLGGVAARRSSTLAIPLGADRADVMIPVPSDPAIVGMRIYAQCLIESSASPAGAAFSNLAQIDVL